MTLLEQQIKKYTREELEELLIKTLNLNEDFLEFGQEVYTCYEVAIASLDTIAPLEDGSSWSSVIMDSLKSRKEKLFS